MEGFARAVFVALLFASVLGHDSGRPGPQVIDFDPFTPPPEFGFSCQAPGEGLWRFQNNFLQDGPDGDYSIAAFAELTVVRVGDSNIYSGTGLLNSANGLFIDIPINLTALYNPATCYLSGTGFSPSTFTANSFSWWSTGTTLYGPYLVSINETLAAPLLGISNATLIGGL